MVDLFSCMLIENCQDGEASIQDAVSRERDTLHFKLHIHIIEPWLPDGYSQILRIVCVWPFGLLDYGSATLRCKI